VKEKSFKWIKWLDADDALPALAITGKFTGPKN
jgi:hypothetical protein